MTNTNQNSEQILSGQVMPAVRLMLGSPELVEMNTPGMEIDPELRESLIKYFDNDKELQAFVDAMLEISTDKEKIEALEDYLAGKIPPEIVGFSAGKFLQDTAEKVAVQRRIGTKPEVTIEGTELEESETPVGSQMTYEATTEDQLKKKTESSYKLEVGTDLKIKGFPPVGLPEIRIKGEREVNIPSSKAPEMPVGRQSATVERQGKKRTSDGGETVNEQQAEQQNIAQQQQQTTNQAAAYLATAQAAQAAAQAEKRAKEKGLSGMAKAGIGTGLGVGTIFAGCGAYTLLDLL